MIYDEKNVYDNAGIISDFFDDYGKLLGCGSQRSILHNRALTLSFVDISQSKSL